MPCTLQTFDTLVMLEPGGTELLCTSAQMPTRCMILQKKQLEMSLDVGCRRNTLVSLMLPGISMVLVSVTKDTEERDGSPMFPWVPMVQLTALTEVLQYIGFQVVIITTSTYRA